MSLDSFVQRVVSTEPGREIDLNSWIKSNIEQFKRSSVAQLDNALQAVAGRRAFNSILALLYAKSQQVINDEDTMLSQIGEFFQTFSPEHVRHLSKFVGQLSHFYTELLCKRREAIRGVLPLTVAAQRFRAHPAQLTSLHADACQLALASGCFKPVIPLLEIDYMEINNEEGYLDAKYVLCFYYYGGCIWAARREFEKALLFFELVLTVPAAAISAIMVDAYKKMLLTSLIVNGRGDVSLDVMIFRYVRRQASLLAQPYAEVVRAFQSDSLSRLEAVIEKERDVFVSDRNLGLVKQVKKALIKQQIMKIARAYATLPLTVLGRQINIEQPNQVADLVTDMVTRGEIKAKLDEHQQLVSFSSSDASSCLEATAFAKIDAEARYLVNVLQQIKSVDESLETNSNWLKRIASGQE